VFCVSCVSKPPIDTKKTWRRCRGLVGGDGLGHGLQLHGQRVVLVGAVDGIEHQRRRGHGRAGRAGGELGVEQISRVLRADDLGAIVLHEIAGAGCIADDFAQASALTAGSIDRRSVRGGAVDPDGGVRLVGGHLVLHDILPGEQHGVAGRRYRGEDRVGAVGGHQLIRHQAAPAAACTLCRA
jgi:hypothetical protein